MPQKQKLSAEEKAKVIENYINNRISLSEAARRGGVARDTISQWARNYEADGMAAFMTCRNRVYSPELKRQAVEDYLSGMGSQAEICRKYHIRKRMQLQAWIQVYNAHGDFNSRKNSGGGSYMKQGRDTTQEERIQIVKDCLASGKDYGEMALKLQGKLPAGTHMDAAVRGDGRGRSGGSARKEEEGSGAQNRAGESADRDRTAQAQAVSGRNGA